MSRSKQGGDIRGPGRPQIMIFSQLATSGTNLLSTVLLARLLAPSAFGVVAAGLLATAFALSLQRSVVGDPLIVLTSDGGARRLVPSGAAWVLLWAGFVTGISLGLDSFIGIPLFLAAMAGMLVLQDGCRYLAFASRRPAAALAGDLAWLCCVMAAAVLSFRSHLTLAEFLELWMVGASGGTIIPLGAVGFLRVIRGAKLCPYAEQARSLAGWLGGQFLLLTGVSTLISLFGASVIGSGAFATFRASQLVCAPILTAVLATSSALVSVFAGLTQSAVWGRAVRLALIFALVSAVPLLGVSIFGSQMLRLLAGLAYARTADLIVPTAVATGLVATAVPLGAALRALQLGRQLFLAQVFGIAPAILVTPILALTYGARGIAWGMVLEMGGNLLSASVVSFRCFGRFRDNRSETCRLGMNPTKASFARRSGAHFGSD